MYEVSPQSFPQICLCYASEKNESCTIKLMRHVRDCIGKNKGNTSSESLIKFTGHV
uniref:Uncharacterized protein n=1 Tax=Arundo donax TaxID=35708 RepID=A0A0A9H2R3_ARUDO